MGICGQCLLMQADMTIRIHIHDREDMVALGDQLASERVHAVRQIQQYPLVVAFFLQLLQGMSELRKYMLMCKRILRSEEHTSELQSREKLVCRLLLEKKK